MDGPRIANSGLKWGKVNRIVITRASLAQLVEHRSRKAGVISSSLIAGSRRTCRSEAFMPLTCFAAEMAKRAVG